MEALEKNALSKLTQKKMELLIIFSNSRVFVVGQQGIEP